MVLNPDKAESHVRQLKKFTEMEPPRGHLLSVADNQALNREMHVPMAIKIRWLLLRLAL